MKKEEEEKGRGKKETLEIRWERVDTKVRLRPSWFYFSASFRLLMTSKDTLEALGLLG